MAPLGEPGTHLLIEVYVKNIEEESFCLRSHWQVHSFSGTGAFFIMILIYTKDQLSYPASMTE